MVTRKKGQATAAVFFWVRTFFVLGSKYKINIHMTYLRNAEEGLER